VEADDVLVLEQPKKFALLGKNGSIKILFESQSTWDQCYQHYFWRLSQKVSAKIGTFIDSECDKVFFCTNYCNFE
jgi:transposase-like protein